MGFFLPNNFHIRTRNALRDVELEQLGAIYFFSVAVGWSFKKYGHDLALIETNRTDVPIYLSVFESLPQNKTMWFALGYLGNPRQNQQESPGLCILTQCLLFTRCFIWETSLATQTRLILPLFSINKT